MSGIRRTIKGCAHRKSLQPLWFGIAAFLLLLCHIVFDARKLFTIRFDNSKITINVAQYGLDRESFPKNAYKLLNQVKNGEKPFFVIEDDMLNRAKKSSQDRSLHKWNILNTSDTKGAIFWDLPVTKYPYMHSYKSFADLPPFSEVQCGDDMGKRVPNIVHFVWFGKLRMTFAQYLSVRSAAAVQKPLFIILHTDGGEPTGKYWKSLRAEISCLDVRYLPRPATIFGKYPTKSLQEQSHVSRIKVLYEEGGIYANLNVIFVRPFDDLMDYSMVLGKEEEQYYGNSVILAEKGAPFLVTWFNAYNRRIVDWSTYSAHIPWRIHQENPDAPIHVEEYTMLRPNFQEDEWIVEKNWVLDENYCVHLYTGRDRIKALVRSSPLDAINMDNTYGQLARIALFGKPYLNEKEREFRSRVHTPIECSSIDDLPKDSAPNIVNYLLPDENFNYKHYLSVRSAVRVLKPWKISIHVLGSVPNNFYWIRMLREVRCVNTMYAAEEEHHLQNSSRATGLNKYMVNYLHNNGGIFLSFDVIVTKPFSELMQHEVVVSKDAAYTGHTNVLIAKKASKFLPVWLSWEKTKPTIERRIEAYQKENPGESIVLLDQFPATSPSTGWKTTNFYHNHARCFLITKRDADVKLSVNEYQVLRDYSLSGIITRIALFGKEDIIT